jgi:hypothetical protein
MYAWDIHAILKKVGLEDLLTTCTNIVGVYTPPTLSLTMIVAQAEGI